MPTITNLLSAQGYTAKTIKSLLQTGKVFIQGMPTADGRREAKSTDIEVRPNAPRVNQGVIPSSYTGMMILSWFINQRVSCLFELQGAIKIEI